MSLYAVLGISTEASSAEIKQAFRKRIKDLHPDLQLTRSSKGAPASPFTVHQVIEAYEILSDQSRRDEYDQARHSAPRTSEFNYREWLKERPDAESKAKLIFYDVLRDRSDEAVVLYAELTRQRTHDLERLLGREDFMDCAFMLALEFERQTDEVQAVSLYRRIAQLESQKPFFRHFFIEVEEHLISILASHTFTLPPRAFVELLDELCLLPFRTTTKANFLTKQSEIYWQAGELLAARRSLERALMTSPRDKNAHRLAKRFGAA